MGSNDTGAPPSEASGPTHPMTDHVIARIGIHATGPGDPCAPGMHLHLSPQVMTADGHVDFGVLGVFLDMASSQAGPGRPFVHTDISVHRIDRPVGTKLVVDAVAAREGKRSAVVHIDVHDDRGTRVAYSCQSVRYMGPPRPEHGDDAARSEMRRMFMERFTGACTLPGPLHDIIGLHRAVGADGAGVWRMPLGPSSRNGFGGLHGGVAFSIVGDAAAGAAAERFGEARTTSAMLRYLAPGRVGPFRAEPLVMPQADGDAFVRVAVYDEGADDLLIILGEVHVVIDR